MDLNVSFLGRIEYGKALEIQYKLHSMRAENQIGDTLLLLEHPPVITLGKRGKYNNILASDKYLAQAGVDVVETNRGGDVTYHGPGQLVGYFIVDLRSYGRSIRNLITGLESAFVDLLKAQYGLEAFSGEKTYTGVWVGNNKITAIGVAVSKSVTMHGFAFNVNTNLEHFKWINPCGFTDRGVTSLKELIGKEFELETVGLQLAQSFCNRFQINYSIQDKEQFLEMED